MNTTNLKAYFKFLSRNKLYTFVTIFGFAVSLMFVLLLTAYIRQELSVDGFHEKKDRIYMMVREYNHGAFSYVSSFANPVGSYVQERCPEVESYTRLVTQSVSVKGYNDEAVRATALYVDSTFFDIFSFPLIKGDPQNALETKYTGILSESFAKKICPDEDPVGKYLKLDEQEVLITGIAKNFPHNTHLPDHDLILNYQMIEYKWHPGILEAWNNSSFPIYFLIKPGADISAKTPTLIEDFKKDYWIYKDNFAKELYFIPLQNVYFGGVTNYMAELKNNNLNTVYLYLSVAILILIIAVLNYINLSVSITVKRGKESAIKKLLGSTRKALFAQFISEAVVMSFIALIIGILLAFITEPFFDNVLSTTLNLKGQFSFGFIVSIVVGIVLIGLISGLFPALIVSRFKPIEVVKGTYNRKVKSTYSKILITLQYVIALVLLIYSSFILLQTQYMKNYDMGFDSNNVFILDNTLKPEQLSGFRDKASTIPGVEKVSFSMGNPVFGGNNNSFVHKGNPVSLEVFDVDSAFFDVFKIKYTTTVESTSGQTNIVNKATYDIYEPDSVTYAVVNDQRNNEYIINGVVDDFHYKPLNQPIGAIAITLKEIKWAWSINIRLEEGADKKQTAELIRNAYADYNGGKIFDSMFAEDVIKTWYEKEDKNLMIMLAFTLLTVIILMMGIIAVTLYYVQQKEKEIALRKIQGATEFEILKLINIDFIKRVLLAFVIAVPIAWFFSNKFLQGFAYKVDLYWWVFACAGLIITVLSAIFVTIQSWKAATRNPVEPLKSE